MGRIVIPRVRQEARQQLQRKRRTGYFANGFGPQEMQLVSKLADLAVAGGGQIARAVQISNREEEQAKAQAEYDQRLQANAEERRAAAQGLVDATDIDGQVEAFFAQQEPPSVRERLPSMSGMNLQSDLVQPRPMRGGVLSPGVLARPGFLAPEDIADEEAYNARQARFGETSALRSAAELMRHQSNMADQAEAAFSLDSYMGTVGGKQIPARLFAHPESQTGQALAMRGDPLAAMRAQAPDIATSSQPVFGSDPEVAAALGADPSLQFRPTTMTAADEYGSMQRRAAREQEMQGRDFRQEAVSGLRDPNDPTIEAVGPAPERKLFRIADILAAAPSARTEEQRAMLLQAASDSPDIQAANLSDLAKGAYRDRAMQAVMKLFPEEEEALSELDMLRMQSMRERMETENLRQQKLQAELDKSAAKAARRANALKSVRPKDSKKEEAYSFYVQHWAKHDRGEMSDEDWVAGAGELANVDPGGLRRWAETNKLSRATRKAATQDANTVMRLRAPRPPAPVRTDLTPSDTSRIQGDIARFKMKEVDAESAINKWKAFLSNPKQLKDSGLTKHQVDQAIAGEREKARVAREIISANEARLKAKPAATPAPSGAVYNAATGQYE